MLPCQPFEVEGPRYVLSWTWCVAQRAHLFPGKMSHLVLKGLLYASGRTPLEVRQRVGKVPDGALGAVLNGFV